MEAALAQPPHHSSSSQEENHRQLIKEVFKTESVLKIMNDCAQECSLKFRASGLAETDDNTVCFKNCTLKGYSMGVGTL